MKRIESFSINHDDLLSGIYVSRTDKVGDSTVTTFDIRMLRPNIEPAMDTGAIHAVEHVGATFLRNYDAISDKMIYLGPMGCRTGFYLILAGEYESKDIVWVVEDMINFIINFKDDVPGAASNECGNYVDLNLELAKYYARKYKAEFLDCVSEKQLVYGGQNE